MFVASERGWKFVITTIFCQASARLCPKRSKSKPWRARGIRSSSLLISPSTTSSLPHPHSPPHPPFILWPFTSFQQPHISPTTSCADHSFTTYPRYPSTHLLLSASGLPLKTARTASCSRGRSEKTPPGHARGS